MYEIILITRWNEDETKV